MTTPTPARRCGPPDTGPAVAIVADRPPTLCRYAAGPVLLLGGERTGRGELARTVEAGATGVAAGRNIWGADSSGRVVESLVGVVHATRQPDATHPERAACSPGRR